ncbi:hypothetical protein [Nonomuraea sp. NPDC003709]
MRAFQTFFAEEVEPLVLAARDAGRARLIAVTLCACWTWGED